MAIKIILPMPPSVNVAYANNSKGRHKTRAHKDWIELCDSIARQEYKYEDDGQGVEIQYKYFSKWLNKDGSTKIKDLHNYQKVLDDYLPNVMKGFDDKYIWKSSHEKIHSDRDEVELTIIDMKYSLQN